MMLRSALVRGSSVIGNRPLPLFTSASYHTTSSRPSAQVQPKQGYKYVNAEEPGDSFMEITDRAAQTVFWTELFRGNLWVIK